MWVFFVVALCYFKGEGGIFNDQSQCFRCYMDMHLDQACMVFGHSRLVLFSRDILKNWTRGRKSFGGQVVLFPLTLVFIHNKMTTRTKMKKYLPNPRGSFQAKY